jgi:hypothetical protein
MNANANPLHRPLAVGDFVIVGEGEEYAGLTGQVREIIPLGSSEHDTGNPTDDIVVDLSVMDYSDNMKAEIAALMKELGYEVDSYADVSIDSVILAPCDLIRITEAERLQYETALTESLESAVFVGDMLSTQHYDRLYSALIDRVEQNYAEYQTSLLGFGQQELIDMAAAIHATDDAHSYMTSYRGYEESELSHYLQFDNPLEILSDHWKKARSDLDDMSFAMDFLNEPERRKLTLEVYPLYIERPKPRVEITLSPKSELTPLQRLKNKMRAEYEGFIADMKTKPPAAILEAAYEKVFKEELLLTIENETPGDEQIAALLTLDTPLDDLYFNWLDTDASYMDMLRDSVDEYTDAVISERKTEQAKTQIPQEPAKPQQKPLPKQPPTLLGEIREAAREVEARKAAQTAPTNQKSTKKENAL